MSYDIRLKSPVTGTTLQLPFEHLMTGGTYEANYDTATGVFTPKPIRDASLNITYNYSEYYTESMDKEKGIRKLYGMTGRESIPLLEQTIEFIKGKYQDPDGTWLKTKRKVKKFYDAEGNETDITDILDARWENRGLEYTTKDTIEIIDEGYTENYWKATTANALIPLHQLLAMAWYRPDGVWDGD